MATHFGTLAWKIPWTEEPGRLQSMGSLRVRCDWATLLSRIGEGNGNPLQCSCLENPRDRGAWWAATYGVAQSQTNLKWLSSSSSIVVQQKPIQYCKAIFLQLKKTKLSGREGEHLQHFDHQRVRTQISDPLYLLFLFWASEHIPPSSPCSIHSPHWSILPAFISSCSKALKTLNPWITFMEFSFMALQRPLSLPHSEVEYQLLPIFLQLRKTRK